MKVADLSSILARLDARIHTLFTWFKFTSEDIHDQHTLSIINLKDTYFDERQLIPLIITRARIQRTEKAVKVATESLEHHY